MAPWCASGMAYQSVLICSILLFTVHAAIINPPSNEAKAACRVLQDHFADKVAYNALSLDLEKNQDYVEATTNFWSIANAGNVPACVFLPEAATEVAFAVTVLNNYTTVPFAVKGGGHNPNVGFSSTGGGILIALQNMAATTLDADKIAHVGPGSRWQDTIAALEPFGRTVVGGRIGEVGVSGYTLGGGLSFLSTQYGLTCDNVVNYEVVTSDSKIVNANERENTDLFYALKGGGGQFGIVTSYSMRTYPIGKVWGGYKVIGYDQKDALISAVHNLTSDYYDPKGAVIVTASYTLATLADIFVVFFFYDSPDGPGEILRQFDAIPSIQDSTAVRSYSDLLQANNAFSLHGQRYLIRFNSLPNLPGDDGIDLYHYQIDSFMEAAERFQLSLPIDSYIFSTAFQPMPHQIVEQSESRGGNRLGMSSLTGDHVWMEYDLSWSLNLTDAQSAKYLTEMTQPIMDYARSKYAGREPTHYASGSVDVTNYSPIFMNDAMFNQDPLRSYGADTFSRLKQIQRQRDPNGLFHKRAGGFKYT